MNRSDFFAALIPYLEPEFKGKGFKWLKAKQVFEKKTNNGFFRVGFYSFAENGCLFVEPDLQIRNNQVEQVFDKYALRNPLDSKDSVTVSATIYGINRMERFSYRNCNIADVESTALHIKEFMSVNGFNFFEKFASIEQLDWLYNNNPTEYIIGNYSVSHRAFVSPILTKLLRKDNYTEVLGFWQNKIMSIGTPKVRDMLLKLFLEMKSDLEEGG